MSLTLALWSGTALAARVFYTAPLTGEEEADVARTVSGAALQPVAELMTGGRALAPADDGALERLAAELEATRPLLDAFDGELQIMSRLSKAAGDVHRLRSPQERDLLIEALLFTGFAVDRYFQDKLGSDDAAAYRFMEGAPGSSPRIAAWVDAAAFYSAPPPSEKSLPEPAQRLAYDNLQAWQRSMPGASFVLGTLAAGAEFFLDGVRISGGPGQRVPVISGRHLWHVSVNGMDLLREDMRVAASADIRIEAPVGPVEVEVLRQLAAAKSDGWEVPAGAMQQIAAFDEPVYLAIHRDGEKLRLLRLDTGRAAQVRVMTASARWVGRAVVGAGWSSSADWLLQHFDASDVDSPENAPISAATVNAATPSFSLGGEYRWAPLFATGLGLDVQLPVGDWHTFPIGGAAGDGTGENREQRALLYPHAALGLPWLQATVGPLFPWYLGLGLKAHVPLIGPVGIDGSAIYGMGLDRPRPDGSVFTPAPYWTAWGGVMVQLPGRR